MYADTSLTASRSFLIALAISLIVSRNVFLSVISSGIRDRILLRLALFLFSSWKGYSVLLLRYSRLSWSLTPPWSLSTASFMLTLRSALWTSRITRSYVNPG